MGDEAYSEIDIPATTGKRTLVVRGGYGRQDVYLGICEDKNAQPDDLIAVDCRELKRVLAGMYLGEAPRGARCGGCQHYGRHKPPWEDTDFWPRWHGHCALHRRMCHANEGGCADWSKNEY